MSKQVHRLSRFDIVDYHPKESNIYVPNEIFSDLQHAITVPSHIAFAYSYYYFITYLYRYAKHAGEYLSQADIKSFLQYARTNQKIDYIIKKGGVLDQIGYTETTTDYPISWSIADELGNPEDLRFTMFSEWKSYDPDFFKYENIRDLFIRRNRKIKRPIKEFSRVITYSEGMEDDTGGTFYDISNTHGIDPSVFLKAMDNEYIGTSGFYLYGYLKFRNDQFPMGYGASLQTLVQETKISESPLVRCLKNLDSFGFISVTRRDFVIGLPVDSRRPNVYQVNPKDQIRELPREIQTRHVYGYKGDEDEGDGMSKVDPFADEPDDLPF